MRFFTKVLRSVERITGARVKTLRTDRGKEFCNDNFELLFEQEGITRETNTTYTLQHTVLQSTWGPNQRVKRDRKKKVGTI